MQSLLLLAQHYRKLARRELNPSYQSELYGIAAGLELAWCINVLSEPSK